MTRISGSGGACEDVGLRALDGAGEIDHFVCQATQ